MKTIKEVVLQDIEEATENGSTSYLDDINSHGCVSGMVNDLIYYADTCKFYEDHKEEISELLSELLISCGVPIGELFRDWDDSDPLVIDTNNQNLLAWFGYEETAKQLTN